ncbi:MAG: radical SAM protein [Deltaproteobacteria bacterium]|nr:radical SAM protein [Deltaproteobacteria bacterium]
MSHILFLTFYNDYSVAVNVLSSLLEDTGRKVSKVYFKLPSKKKVDWFASDTMCMEGVDAYGDIFAGNAEVNPWSTEELELLRRLVADLSPDFLCISSRSPDREIAIDALTYIRQVFKGTILAGGFGPTLDPETYAEYVDYVFVGEAENAIVDLIERLERKESIEGLDNVCFKKSGTIVKNKLRLPDISLFRLHNNIDNSHYIEHGKLYDKSQRGEIVATHTYSTFFGRGCVNACTYCSAGQWSSVYRKESINIKLRRNRHLEDLYEEFERVSQIRNCTFVFFRDSFLSAPSRSLIDFFNWYEKKVAIPFWAYLVPKQILNNPEVLRAAVNAGFVDTEVGFQSGSERINKAIFRRSITLPDTLNYVNLLSEMNVNIKCDFIIFNPAEEWKDTEATIQLIQRLPQKRSYLYLPRLVHFPGTPIHEILLEAGYKERSFEYYYRNALLYLMSFAMSESELLSVMKDDAIMNSHTEMLSYYQAYLKENNIDFSIGTHAVPESITSHRYKNIIQNSGYDDAIVVGDKDYYERTASAFEGINISKHLIDSSAGGVKSFDLCGSILENDSDETPIFVCSKNKSEIKSTLLTRYPESSNRVYV